MKKAKFLCVFAALLMLCSCDKEDHSNYCTINFDTNTTLNASRASSQKVVKGGKVKRPSSQIVGANPDNYQVFAWYKEKDCINEWNFKKDKAENNMTLFAKWEKKYTVKYFVGDNKSPISTTTVFNGFTVKEHAEYCLGYEYLGSYTDEEFTSPFDYSTPITSNLDIYMKKSDAICLYEGNKAGNLFDNLEIHAPTDGKGEIGNISKTDDKTAIKVNFGYSPVGTDPFVELAINIDITKSPVMYFRVRNLGEADSMSFYYTTITDINNYIYSATGNDYTEIFSEKHIYTAEEKQKMADGEFIDIKVDFANPSRGLYHGYSVWGTSTHLGKMRIQSTYKSKNYEDRSNEVIFEKIWGSMDGYDNGVITQDTEEIKNLCKDDSSIMPQPAANDGFVFPKDFDLVEDSATTKSYKKNNGLLVSFKNEIEMRKETNKYQKVSINLPMEGYHVVGDKQISLDQYKTVYVTLQNYSYVDSIDVYIHNDYGGTAHTTFKVPTRMTEPRVFIANLSKESTMAHTLTGIDFEIIASGVDNAIMISKIAFGEAKPADISGVDFDDKNCFGFEGNNVDVSYASSSSSVQFNVKESGSFVTSTKNDIKLTNRGYYNLNLTYTRPKGSEIKKVFVSFSDGNQYSSEIEFELDASITTIKSLVKEMDPLSTGLIKNIKLRFEGTGIIRVRSLRFEVNDSYNLNLANDFSNAYDPTWLKGISLSYDQTREATSFSVSNQPGDKNASFYFGPGRSSFPIAYNCMNMNCNGKTKIVIVYHNDNANASCIMIPAFSYSNNDIPDLVTGIINFRECPVTFVGNMSEYEWGYVEIDIPSELSSMYLGKISFRNLSSTISVRLVAVI